MFTHLLVAVMLAAAIPAPARGVPSAEPAPLAQSVTAFTFTLPAAPDRVFPLFGPVREAEWAPGWAPVFLHPAGGAQREGTVFTAVTPYGPATWVLTEFDAAAGRADYVHLTATVLTEIKIRVVAADAGRSRVTVTYRRSALSASANAVVAGFGPAWEREQQERWERLISESIRPGPR